MTESNDDGVPTERQSAVESGSPDRQLRRRIVSWSMVGAGVVILAVTGWVGWRSYQAYSHLQTASAEVSSLQDQLKDITNVDTAATSQAIGRLQQAAASARSAVEDPVFRSATAVPLVGPNLDALREIAVAVDGLATDVMPSMVDVAQTLQPVQLAPADGAINLEPIERISPLLQNADDAVRQARAQMAAIDRSALVQPVGDAVSALWRKLDQAAAVTEPGARIARLLPPMLGSTGVRSYLVVFQNPAELRATGGIFGSFAVISADQGKISILEQGAASRTLGRFDPPAAELTVDQQNLYGSKMARFPQDVNFTPDFPSAARLFAEMYRQRTGNTVDGVLAIDPVALSYLLKGTAPIDVGDGVTITSDNLVSTLLSTAYAKFDGAQNQSQRDDFLARATGLAFSQVMSGQGDPRAILTGLRKGSDERRVLLYSADESEQADIAATDIAGAIDENAGSPSIGVFLNDVTEAKLGYYLHNEVQVTEGECRADGRRELSVRVRMHNQAPAEGLPAYVLGSSAEGKAATLRTNLLVYAPIGGAIVGATGPDGDAMPIRRGLDQSREVGWSTVTLAAGATAELTYTLLVAAPGDSEIQPQLLLTPGVSPWVSSADAFRGCRTAPQ